MPHLLFGCRYTIRLWGSVKNWLGVHALDPSQWTDLSLSSWWLTMMGELILNRKAMASITLLTSWVIWNERNAHVYRNKHAPPTVLLEEIKTEARLWVIAGAKRLGELLPRE